MDKKNVKILERIAKDREYSNEILQLENRTAYRLRTASVIPRIESEKDLQMVLDTGLTMHNTYGLSMPILAASKLLDNRIKGSRQRGMTTDSVDQAFVDMMQNAIVVMEPEAANLAYKTTYEDYLEFIKSIAGRLDFVTNMEAAYKDDKRNLQLYEEAWAKLVKNDTEIVKLTEKYLSHQVRLQGKMPIGFTRMIEGYPSDAIEHAAALNREANTVCESQGWSKTLNLSIGGTALSRISIIKQLRAAVLEKGRFGNSFDYAYITMPNYGIRNSIAQWKNMEIVFDMVDSLRKNNIVVVMGNVDWALAEVCMARGIAYASTSISGKRAVFGGGGSGGPEKYGKMPLPDSYDWQEFYSFNDNFIDPQGYNGTYPYYSHAAVQLNDRDLLSYKPKAINMIRRQIFLEALDNQNAYRITAAQQGVLVEGTIKRLWESSKPDYTKFLSFNPFPRTQTVQSP
jgi:hypothetical protein